MGTPKTSNENGSAVVIQHQDRRCDECGRKVAKLTRRRQGHGYCATCYARIFKRRPCPGCGELARLPRDIPEAICRRCEINKPCMRCGKAEYRIGKITSYGPVCNACSLHFQEPKPCEDCGRPSRRLTKVKRLGHNRRICPSCATKDHGTCSACRRYRLLVITPEGKELCHTCYERGDIACPSCDGMMPAGRGNMCETCYWEWSCRKRLAINQAAFTELEMSRVYGDFGEWLMHTVGPKKAALKVNHYLSFFLDIEKNWQQIPSYLELLNYFEAEGLRRVRLPMRWLHEVKGVEPDAQAKRLHSEKRRIREYLTSLPSSSQAEKAFHHYWGRLESRIMDGKTSYTSARLALGAAASLLLKTDPTGQRLPAQDDVDNYLVTAPGQAATLTGFTNFLNRQYGISLKPTVNKKRASKKRKKKLEKTLMVMAQYSEKDETWRWKWIALSLEYFHGKKVPEKAICQEEIEDCGDGILITLDGMRYWLPLP